MADEARVQHLLDEILDSERTPEEVCDHCPELLPEVRKRWQQMRMVEAQLNALFPTPGPNEAEASIPRPPSTEMPRIPGYEVEAELGRGGMGIVYKARHVRLNRSVALKMLLAGAYAGPDERRRFLREAEAVARLRHANIVQVFDVGDQDGRPYFTMEYVEGGSLAQTVSGAPQPIGRAAGLLATLAEAMQVAHEGGIVHRDLKPANVLLTAKGTPKIADFGLARDCGGGPALTLSGARVGTPSYMAPEQAMGKAHGVGPAVDVYALGAVLYELLTGRPPFRGETATETELQVIYQEPVPPSRLNAKVPRDLETICLKCLHKAPERRYTTAADLAEDLRRFQRGEPIAARPAGLSERAGKWIRRHPTESAMLAASALCAAVLVGASQWLVVQQARQRDAVEADLKELTRLQDSARWTEAQATLNHAKARLGGGGPADLRRRLERAQHDFDLIIELDNIRLRRVTRGELAFYKAQADRAYAEAFEQAGLGPTGGQSQGMTAAINASAVRGALVVALLDWAVCAVDPGQRRRLLEVVQQTDSDPDAWRKRLLDPAAWEDAQALAELARTADVANHSASLLLALGERLKSTDQDLVPFLKRVQQQYPADFWANLILGNTVLYSRPVDAGGYYRAALASRPGAAVGYCAVGDALRLQNELPEAIYYYRKSLQLDRDYSRAHSVLGLALQAQDQREEAVACFRKSLQLDPDYAWAHHNLGNALRAKGQGDEAYHHYQELLRVDPKNPEVQNCLASVLLPQGRGAEAQAGWRRALDANPPEHTAWVGYPELCLFLGQQQEYQRVRRALLARFGATANPYVAEPIGRACLLLPAAGDELGKAVALVDRAVAAKASTPEWIFRYFLLAKGLAEYRQGRLASAISMMEGQASTVMGPAPRLTLAMAQHNLGQRGQARKTLARAIVAFDWSAAQADIRDVWIAHLLRREAEALIVPNLPACLHGECQPQDNDERLTLVGVCQFQGLHNAAARWYSEAFTADRTLAEELAKECRSRAALGDSQPVGRIEELATECRFPAARSAALVGCGLAADGAKLSETERTRWRKQARDWLQADLAVWAQVVDGGSRAGRILVKNKLTHWQVDPGLAGLREGSSLAKLPADERKECVGLWKAVAALHHRVSTIK
jgi:serine/threonine-protein kinase